MSWDRLLTRAKQSVADGVRKSFLQLGYEIQKADPDTSELVFVVDLLRRRDVDLVLDVGANVGRYVRALRRHGWRGPVVSFEPLPDAHAELERTARSDGNWTVAPRVAIGDAHGETVIHISGNSVSSSLLEMLPTHQTASPKSRYVADAPVTVERLDVAARDYVASARTLFLKLDVQGYEPQVLDGASGLLDKVAGIQCEVSLVPLYGKGQKLLVEMIALMESRGLQLYGLFPGFVHPESGQMLQAEACFFRR
jgi:FkbM family methyltransferase